jgi:hypothetical protein
MQCCCSAEINAMQAGGHSLETGLAANARRMDVAHASSPSLLSRQPQVKQNRKGF